MTPRTKLLISVGAAVLLLIVADRVYQDWVELPSQQTQAQIDRMDAELRQIHDAQAAARKAGRRLAQFETRSLPSDPELARSLYLDWLLGLVESHRWGSAAIDAGVPTPIEIKSRSGSRKRRLIGHSISVSLRAKTTLPQLVNLIHDLESAGHLHKIRNLALVPLGAGNELDVSLAIEAISLRGADRTDALSDLKRIDEEADPQVTYQDLMRRNFFARGISRALAQIKLQAVTTDRQGRVEAWFLAGTPATTQIVTEGESLALVTHEVKVDRIEQDGVQLLVNQSPYWIALGQTLGDVLISSEPKSLASAGKRE